MEKNDLSRTGIENNAPLFRGLSVDSREWIFGYGWIENGEHAELFTKDGLVLCIKDSMGQFTGITDKNGKKVFKGDMFYWHGALRKVIFREDKGAFMAMRVAGWQKSYFYLNDLSGKLEVIGNETENNNLPPEII